MHLTNPTDDQLSAAFAEKVAGWFRAERMGKQVLYDPEGGHVLIGDTRCMPQFTTSADAVLPWLEKCAEWECIRNRARLPTTATHGVRVIVSKPDHPDGCIAGYGEAISFAVAAVIALLRAHGVEVEFTK